MNTLPSTFPAQPGHKGVKNFGIILNYACFYDVTRCYMGTLRPSWIGTSLIVTPEGLAHIQGSGYGVRSNGVVHILGHGQVSLGSRGGQLLLTAC